MNKKSMSLKDRLKQIGVYDDWVPISYKGLETTYVCNENGDIANTKRKGNAYEHSVFKILKPIKMPNEYYVVTLSINGKTYREYVHRIIAMAFLEIPEKYASLNLTVEMLEVNHKDGNKGNNALYNLEWSTGTDNKKHAYQTGLSKVGEDNSLSLYTNDQVHKVCHLLEENKLKPSTNSKRINKKLYQASMKAQRLGKARQPH
jgi:hypothetical protein